MKLLIKGQAGTRVCDWESYALLRDNVQHYLENGEASWRFPALHGIERAVDTGAQVVDASRLRGEVLRAWCALWKVRLDEAAISLRTRAILTSNPELPDVRGTIAARQAGWELPLTADAETPIPRAARRFIQTVLVLTSASVDGDELEIRCVPSETRSVAGGALAGSAGSSSAPTARVRLMAALTTVSALGLFLVAGCGAAVSQPPQGPASDASDAGQLSEARPADEHGEQAPIIAPPPAYGNKIVRSASSLAGSSKT